MPLPREYRELAALKGIAEVHRTRDGRLAVNWLSRREVARWRMLALNGQWYDRGRLRQRVSSNTSQGRVAVVPHSSRRMTNAEVAEALNLNPWSLAPGRAPR
jgi:hypothetical protein